MSYKLSSVKQYMLSEWEDDDYFILKYIPWRSAQHNDATTFIMDCKGGIPAAIGDARGFFISAIDGMEGLLKGQYNCRYVVSIPSHTAGESNSPCEQICSAIAKRTWLTHIPNALVRIKDVPKSAWSKTSERPDKMTHLNSITYQGLKISDKNFSFIMIDDVYTLSHTSSACREILIKATKCIKVIGIFLGRTQSVD